MDKFDKGFVEAFVGITLCSFIGCFGTIFFNETLGVLSLLFLIAFPIGGVIASHGFNLILNVHSGIEETKKEKS